MGPDDARYELAGLGDLMELIVDGWRIARLHYADRSEVSGPPAAVFDLTRGVDERLGVYVPDDGRAFSHRALVELFRENPNVWKYRTPDGIPAPPIADAAPAADWGAGVAEPFPEAIVFGPATLREVVPVNQIQSVGGLDIALVSLERHEGGGRLRYMCHASSATAPTEMSVLDVIAVDDAGRLYRVAGVESRPEDNRLEGALVVAPAIPPDVRLLTVSIGTVWDTHEGLVQTPGPWVFPIPLAPEG
jgi:hypothetical protein